MDVYVERANTFAVQIKSIYMANVPHSKYIHTYTQQYN